MLTQTDYNQLKELGVSPETIESQITQFKQGFAFMKMIKAATIDDGIIRLDDEHLNHFVNLFEKEKQKYNVVKFVPASGAATRMFKAMYEFLDWYNDTPEKYEEMKAKAGFGSMYYFFKNIEKFAFWNDLQKTFLAENTTAEEMMLQKKFKEVVAKILNDNGLKYGTLPKGLLKFHRYENGNRTSFEEHLVEGAQMINIQGKTNLHFTVSPDHEALFSELFHTVEEEYESKYNTLYITSFSQQKKSTDTLAVDPNNEPFRDKDGKLVFRPGGHGALIENLNDLFADMVFIKNIDNVAPDYLKPYTYSYTKAMAGVLLHFQEKIKEYLIKLDNFEELDDDTLDEIGEFLVHNLCNLPADKFIPRNRLERIVYLRKKLDRPIRVCGMVKNEGEPGGGPYWCVNRDGTVSLQIVESSQMDMNDAHTKNLVASATHFNPVNMVCYIRNYKGMKFDLTKFVDPNTGFISEKSMGGKNLKALELPGLWNGAMSDWITIFVEMPIETFNPVKTVHDLLRPQHQPLES